MDGFDNLFDQAMSSADDQIIATMGTEVVIFADGVARPPIRAVFDTPEDNNSISNGNGGEIRDAAPTLFARSVDVTGLKKHDRVEIHGETFRVTDPGWDELGGDKRGCVTITLARGKPDTPVSTLKAPSKPYGT